MEAWGEAVWGWERGDSEVMGLEFVRVGVGVGTGFENG